MRRAASPKPPGEWILASEPKAREPYQLDLSIPWLPSLNTSLTRRHWATQHREARRLREAVGLLVGRRRPPRPLLRARVTLRRHSSCEPDYDNLVWSFKPVVDALVHARVLVDDGPECVERRYRWEPAPRNRGHIDMLVEELPE